MFFCHSLDRWVRTVPLFAGNPNVTRPQRLGMPIGLSSKRRRTRRIATAHSLTERGIKTPRPASTHAVDIPINRVQIGGPMNTPTVVRMKVVATICRRHSVVTVGTRPLRHAAYDRGLPISTSSTPQARRGTRTRSTRRGGEICRIRAPESFRAKRSKRAALRMLATSMHALQHGIG